MVREVEKTKPDKWGYVQTRELWSMKEETHMSPGHNWVMKFGKFAGLLKHELRREGVQVGPPTGLTFEVHRSHLRLRREGVQVGPPVSGLTFEEWDPSPDTDVSQDTVEMIVNSIHLCTTDFDLREVIPLQLKTVTRGVRCTRGATLK